MWYLLIIVACDAALVSVVETFRHGARSPVKQFSWDNAVWPQGYGELTPEGMRQHYLNGVEFRNRYIQTAQLFGPSYSIEQVYVRSTNLNRTLMSAESQLFGLFPQGATIKNQVLAQKAIPPIQVKGLATVQDELGLNAVINRYQMIPINTVTEPYDNMLSGYRLANCPRFAEIQKEQQGSSNYERMVTQYNDGLQQQVLEVFGVNATFSECGLFSDTLHSMLFHGYNWPAGVTQDMYNAMEEVLTFDYSYYFTAEAASLSSTEFIQAVFDQFDSTINGTGTVKMSLYSTHDVTLIGFMIFLGIWDNINPPYASSIIFELYDNDDAYQIQVLYNDVLQTIPGCENPCSYQTFKNLVTPKLTPDVRKACQLKGITSKIEIDPLSVIYRYT